MATTFHQLYIHYIFSTKKRYHLILPEYEKRLWSYISGICKSNGYPVIVIGGTSDHIHILLSLSPSKSISKTIQEIKGNSSKWMNDTFFIKDRRFKWQIGFGAFSIGKSSVNSVKKYILNQKKHHEVKTFEEEFLWFLEHYKIEYNKRYIWD